MIHDYPMSPEWVWEDALTDYHIDPSEAYKVARMKPILPEPDRVDLTDKLAAELRDLGQDCGWINPSDAPLPIFTISFLFEEPDTEIRNISHAEHPYRDASVFGIDTLFIAKGDCVTCAITFFETHGDSGGMVDMGVINLFDDLKGGFRVCPVAISEENIILSDFKTLNNVSHWLGYLWKGIQYRMSHRPETVRVKHSRFCKKTIDELKKKTSGSKRIVKVQKVITILAEDYITSAVASGTHKITASFWGVSGHWRTLKSNNRIWIRPYYKGRERNKQGPYWTKEYRFVEEVIK